MRGARAGALSCAALSLATFSLAVAGESGAQEKVGGDALFRQQCAVCHAAVKDEPHRQGPTLWGVVGHKAGSSADFSYSPEFKKAMAGKVWSEALLDRWIADPQAVASGTTMGYQQADAEKRAAIIGYLKTLK